MKKHLPSVAVLSTLLLVLCLHAFAAENDTFDSGVRTSASAGAGYVFTNLQEATYTDYREVIPLLSAARPDGNLRTEPDITANGTSIGHYTARILVDGEEYLAATPLLRALYPDVVLDHQDGHLTAATEAFTLRAVEGDAYFEVNGRFFYAPGTLIAHNNDLLLPARTLTEALGCSLILDEATDEMTIRQVEGPAAAKVYDEEDLYWLSHIIYAESGNQPMKGRIAVGTVVLNRVAHPSYPNTIYDVVFAPGQFSPVDNGTIYLEPDKDSLVAAMLCLDGVKEADDCLFFNVTTMHSWADRARTYCCTIGGHNFYL